MGSYRTTMRYMFVVFQFPEESLTHLAPLAILSVPHVTGKLGANA